MDVAPRKMNYQCFVRHRRQLEHFSRRWMLDSQAWTYRAVIVAVFH